MSSFPFNRIFASITASLFLSKRELTPVIIRRMSLTTLVSTESATPWSFALITIPATNLPPLVSEHNNTQLAYEYAPRFDPTALIIPKTTPYYREIIRWMDQLYALENESLQSRGVKDVHWREMDDLDAPWGVHPVRPLYGGDGR